MLVVKEAETKLYNILALCKKLDVEEMGEFLEIRTRRIPLMFNQPSNLSGFFSSYLSVDGSIQYDDNFNVIIVHDHKTKLDMIEKEIKKFDVPPKQVKIDVKIVEISSSGMLDAGINWDALFEGGSISASWNTDNSLTVSTQHSDDYLDNGETVDIDDRKDENKTFRDDSRVSVGVNIPKISEFVRILEEKGQAKISSSPSIITLNNKMGYIGFGSKQKGRITLRVTPHIGESKLIVLDLDCELGDASGYEQSIDNQILVKEGTTFVLGGMTKVNEVKTKKRVPILGSILPILFSKHIITQETVEVAIMLTPHIIDVNTFGEVSTEEEKVENK
ncbi:MAG: hypothetical protein H8E61_02925, partial [Bacteroidetes bacterium]|nr:hypothetical protein [Bacteroidota bacterium]